MKFSKIIFNIFLFVTYALLLELGFSQTQPIFQKLDQSNGLSNGRVTSIKKGTNGFIWIGTKDGLNRYDGFELKVYTKRNSNISSNDISDILIDSSGRMWVTTLGGGLNLYNPLVDDFKVYKNIPGDPKSIASNQLNMIFEDSKGFLWIGTENGLSVKTPGEETFKSYTHLNDDTNSITHNSVRSIYEDISGNIWIGTFGGGLNKFDRVKETFSSVNSRGKFYTGFIYVISPLSENEILIGTSGSGLLKIDITDHSFSDYFDNNLQGLSNVNIVRTIHQDHKNDLWIGTDGHGVFKVEKPGTENPNVFNYLYDSRIESSLSGNAVYEIYEDKEGNIWIGTAWNGVNILSQENIYDFFYSDIKGIDPSPVLAINKKDNKLYLGLDGKGLTVYNTELSKATYYNEDEDSSIGANYLQFITPSTEGTFWIGTFANGLINFNPETGKHEQYKHNLNNVESLSYNDVRYVIEEESGDLWVATWGGGLNYLNTKSGKFHSYRENKNLINSISSNNVISLQKDTNGKIWIATFGGGLNLFDPSTGKFTHFRFNENNPNSISSDNVLSLLLDSRGNLWIGTSGEGLNRYEPGSNKFERFNENEEIRYSTVTAIIEDDKGTVWFSTKQGIMSYNYKNNSFNTYPDLIGEFHINSAFKDDEGFLYFGGTNGVVKFNPENISKSTDHPVTQLTNFKLFNRDIKIGVENVLSESISYEDHITLSHDNDVITFEFAALQFPFSNNCEYTIKMENFDEDWRDIGKDRTATYTNLPPGDYTFKVKSKNIGSEWGQNYSSVNLTILKPFWLRWWAWTIYTFLFFLLVYLFRKYIIAWERMKLKLKMEQLTHEKDTELYNLKQQFFTNISHEIRTPVTLILNSINRLFEKGDVTDKKQFNSINVIKRNGIHLLKLINELLDFRKLESNEIKLKVTENNWVEFCREIYLSFNELALKKNIEFNFISKEDTIKLWFDKNQMEKVVYNLLSNAFKFTKEGGTIELIVEADTSSASLKVSDTGIGISEEELLNIFNRFYQTAETDKESDLGFGLGLSISKSFVELHHGEIQVKSKKNEGSTFVVILHQGKTHFRKEEIIEDYKDEEQIERYLMPSWNDPLEENEHEEPFLRNDKNFTILIVEDNRDIQKLLKEILSTEFNVIKADNGEEGFKSALEKLPDLIISDVMMPVMDGITFTRELKSNPVTSHIPVILLTARTSFIHKKEGYETGADEYLIKPFNETLLKARIKNILRNRQLLKEKFSTEALTKPSTLAINNLDRLFLEKLMQILENNIDDRDLSASFLSKELGMSHSVIYKKIKAITGLTFQDFVRDFKLKRAKQLIEEKGYSVSDACYRVGYSDRKYFSKLFKQRFGKNPSTLSKSK